MISEPVYTPSPHDLVPARLGAAHRLRSSIERGLAAADPDRGYRPEGTSVYRNKDGAQRADGTWAGRVSLLSPEL